MGIKIPQGLIDLILSGLMKLDFLPFLKTKIGAAVLVISQLITQIPLPEGAPAPPLAEIGVVLEWVGTVIVLYGLAIWSARSAADKRGIPTPYVLNAKRLRQEILGK